MEDENNLNPDQDRVDPSEDLDPLPREPGSVDPSEDEQGDDEGGEQ